MNLDQSLRLCLLGTPHITTADGSQLTMENHALVQLLALLTLNPKKSYLRSELCSLFYPEHSEKQADQNVRQMIHRLRKAVNDREDSDSLLIREPLTLRLNSDHPYWVDVDEFNRILEAVHKHNHRRVTACQHCIEGLEHAISLYKDEFMSGIQFRGPLEEWVFIQRMTISQKLIYAFRTLTTCFLQQGQWLKAQMYVDRWLKLDALDEEAAAVQMRLLTLQGKRTRALQFFHEFEGLLFSRLEIEPGDDLTALAHSIQNSATPGESLPSVPTMGLPMTVVPPLLTGKRTPAELCNLQIPFTGRSAEINGIIDRLADDSTRLITITGMSGTGKTRLALHAAGLDGRNWLDGVVFAWMGDAHNLVQGLTGALSIPLDSTLALDIQLFTYLHDREMLIVLDHLDQLPDSRHMIQRLLFRAPKIRIIVTSCQRLGIAGEIIIQLGGLPYPKQHSDYVQAFENYTIDSTGEHAAVELFYESARSIHPQIALSERDLPFIAEICRLVCGYPFAIVLAAAWVRVLSTRQIVERIRDDIGFLKDVYHNLPVEQESLQTVFDNSWKLLDPHERKSLKYLTRTNIPFTIEQASCDYAVEVETIIALLDKSLLEAVEPEHFQTHPLFRRFILQK